MWVSTEHVLIFNYKFLHYPFEKSTVSNEHGSYVSWMLKWTTVFLYCLKTINYIFNVNNLKAALAVNIILFFSPPKLTNMKNKQLKRVFGSLFRLEPNRHCSTFTIRIEFLLIYSMNMFLFACKQIYIDTPF